MQQAKLSSLTVPSTDRQKLGADLHIYKVADFYKVSPIDVMGWDDDIVSNAVSYIAIKEKAMSKK